VFEARWRVRIAIPDLEYAISLYKAGHKEKMLSDYFFVEIKDSYYARHKYMYDYEMISDALMQSGFQDIQRCKFREGVFPTSRFSINILMRVCSLRRCGNGWPT